MTEGLQYVVIPSRGDIANYDQKVTLEKKVFSFRFRYNQRNDCWFLNIWDDQGNQIKTGIKLVPNFFLIRWLKTDTWGIGQLMAYDSRSKPIPAQLADLGDKVQIVYVGLNP